jgi:cytochrome c oxidase assembly factor 2
MPPALHPRSSQTLSLFTTTLALSFIVVALPHVIPCPVDRRPRALAEGSIPGAADGARRKRRRKDNDAADPAAATAARSDKECPIPKPTGLLARMLGTGEREPVRRPVVRVEEYRGVRRKDGDPEQGRGK